MAVPFMRSLIIRNISGEGEADRNSKCGKISNEKLSSIRPRICTNFMLLQNESNYKMFALDED